MGAPSRRRREGRKAFDPNITSTLVCPYKGQNFMSERAREDWMDGWKEAEADYKEALELKQEFKEAESDNVTLYTVSLFSGVAWKWLTLTIIARSHEELMDLIEKEYPLEIRTQPYASGKEDSVSIEDESNITLPHILSEINQNQ